MKNTLLLLVVLFVGNTTLAQISFEQRIELDNVKGYYDQEIHEFGSYGLLYSSRGKRTDKKQYKWSFEKYNTKLEKIESNSIYISDDYRSYLSHTDETHIYRFFLRKGKYLILSLDITTMEFTKVEGKMPKKIYLHDFSVLGNFAYVEAYIKKVPVLYAINWKTGEKQLIRITIPKSNPKRNSIENMQYLEKDNEVLVYVKGYVDRRKQETYVMKLNEQGGKEDMFKLENGLDTNLIDITASKINENSYIFSGTYSAHSAHNSEGMFFCRVNDKKIEFIRYYKFINLKNFLSYLPQKTQKKIEKKRKKKERKGKDYVRSYNIAPHDIILLKDGYLLLGEAYYATYYTRTYTTTTFVNGVATTTTHTEQVFDGYQYTHAFLGKFDFQGRLVWDQVLEMHVINKPFKVKRFISVAEQDSNSIKLIYSTYNKITTKAFNLDGKIIKEYQSEKIEPKNKGDKTKRSFSNVDYWYDNYFIAYGRQKIKNKEKEDKEKRKRWVYFISKIKFE
jgi:hypothetical protein